jgi:hypothetical protein
MRGILVERARADPQTQTATVRVAPSCTITTERQQTLKSPSYALRMLGRSAAECSGAGDRAPIPN